MLSFGAQANDSHAEHAMTKSTQPMQHMMVGDDCPTMKKDKEKCSHGGMHTPSATCLYEGKLYSEGAVLKMPDGIYRCADQQNMVAQEFPAEGKTRSRLIWVPVKGSPKPAK
ncbi:MAG: hypothetical protein A3F73_04515 [Gallionellales bacterium RIFCSPLOWO2_12_FULL_59_22]|nr:MAG: hypothetical protein A2Z65_12535 [Gallionellales bacterium RIFCSPLOWO2_02_58_13]OGT14249.1 MAG: hypothetical protein A3F73_04515 [Gallionellales bacterium RIFCSPLOWO2_12_FULL_59_22]